MCALRLSHAQLLFTEQQSMSLPAIPVSSLSQSASHSHLDEVMEEHIMRDDFSTTATAGECVQQLP